jgi:hypothetical protein
MGGGGSLSEWRCRDDSQSPSLEGSALARGSGFLAGGHYGWYAEANVVAVGQSINALRMHRLRVQRVSCAESCSRGPRYSVVDRRPILVVRTCAMTYTRGFPCVQSVNPLAVRPASNANGVQKCLKV